MKAAVFKEKGVLTVEEIPTPEPKFGEVLCRVKYCGICGTDLHNYSYGITAPGSILGHEWCGVITKLGEGVEDFSVGERVMLYKHPWVPLVPPGKRNDPRNIRLNPRAIYSAPSRMGAYAEYIAAPTTRITRIPDEITDEAAACLEPLVAAIHAVRLGNLKVSDTVAFIGAGPIALFMIQRVKQAGARAIYVSEISSARAAKAEELGSDRVFNPLKEDIITEIVKLTGGRGPDIVYECAAGKNTLNQACQLVARNGRVTCLAVYQEPILLEPLDWYMMQPEIKFTTNGDSTPFDWEIAKEVLCQNSIDVETVITNVIPLSKIQETFQALLKPVTNDMLRVLVKP
ncbi:MAG: zinc-binding dehydrogenase [Dehalococcoidales bacterium]|nr:zinc-binding dehydrogenase [Dehalococcoidales bacterium]